MNSPDANDPRTPVYEERNRLLALLAAFYPCSLERHPDEDQEWEDDWRWIVFLDLEGGQASWHIHDSHLRLFAHVPRLQGRVWDGHSTQDKYIRVEETIKALEAPE